MIRVRTIRNITKGRKLLSLRLRRDLDRFGQTNILSQGRTALDYPQVLSNNSRRKWRRGVWQIQR